MRRKKQRARRADKRLGVESLEERQLLTAVTSAADAGPGTLREAAGSNDGTITFALPAGTDTITLSSGQIVISSAVTIDGADPVNGNITIDAAGTSRVLLIDDGVNTGSYVDVELRNLTITGGYANAPTVNCAAPQPDSGGIQSFEQLTLDNVIVTGNSVVGGGDAGGIGHGNEVCTAGDLLIMNSSISNNRTDDDASAIDHYNAANFTLIDSVVSGNTNGVDGGAPGLGGVVGAIRVIDLSTVTSPATTATVERTVFDSNRFVGDGNVGYAVPLGTLLITDQNGVMTANIDEITINNTINDIIPDAAGVNQTATQGAGLTLTTMADATVSNSRFTNHDVGYGGGVFISNAVGYASNVTLNNLVISGNTTSDVGFDTTQDPFFPPGGAGLFINGNDQLNDLSVTVNDSAITGNSSMGVGGGIYLYRASLTLNNTTVSGNTAGTKGGALFMNGGFYNYPNPSDGGLYLNNSTITDNSADIGGGFYLSGYYGSYGYGNYQQSYLTLNHTIISGNQAATAGPDIYDFDALNVGSPGCPDDCNSIKAATYSIVGDNSGTKLVAANPVPNADGSLIGETGNLVDAGLNPLDNNGGDTLTHSLMSGSVALNAGDPAAMAGVGNVPEFDQRGDPYTRVLDGRIDIGAFEGTGGGDGIPGDFNDDMLLDLMDIDMLTAETAAATNNPDFDLNDDMLVNGADIDVWLSLAGAMNLMSGNPYARGDANLDGLVDGLDFIAWNNNKFTNSTAWSGGNFNGDAVTDGLDFIEWNTNKFTQQGPIIQGPDTPSTTDVGGGHLVADVGQPARRLATNAQRASFEVEQTSTEVRRTADQVENQHVLDQVFAQLVT